MTEYAELHCHSYFSLLDAASSPEDLVARAQGLGLAVIALTDHDSLAGAIRFWKTAKKSGIHPIIGAEVTLAGNQHLTLLAENQRGYANLCRLLTAAHLRDARADSSAEATLSSSTAPTPRVNSVEDVSGSLTQWAGKSDPCVSWEDLGKHQEGLLTLSGCRRGPIATALLEGDLAQAQKMATWLCDTFGRARVWIELQHHRLPGDDRLVRELVMLARSLDLPCVATNDVHYATRTASRLRDALIAIRHNQSLTEARRAGRLPFNHNYDLVSPDEMARRFAEVPQAISNSVEIARRCEVSLDFSNQRLPTFPVPDDRSEFAYLYQLCHDGLPRHYPQLKPNVLNQLAHELSVIEQAGLAGYFLIVWDIVHFAREQGVPLELELDEHDPRCDHALAFAADGAAVGTGRLLPDGHVGRMAVLSEWRGQGVGALLLQILVEQARQRGHAHVRLNAQCYATGFYRRYGFEVTGPEFMDAGIPHVAMQRELTSAPA